MNALELVERIEAAGEQFTVEGADLVILPGDAALPLLAELRLHKQEIILLIQNRTATLAETPIDDLLSGEWLLEQCVFKDRWWGGTGALYLSLARWCADHKRPMPESRRSFVAALQAEGFAVTTDGLVYGLTLREDLEALQ
jgi:hypothetical protein